MVPKIPPHRWTLEELQAEWRTDDIPAHRYNVGLSWQCPRHSRVHRLCVQLVNPFDSEDEVFWLGATRAYGLFEDVEERRGLGSLTLMHPDGGETLRFGFCGAMRVVEGVVELVLNGA